jgi:hypothetical protein
MKDLKIVQELIFIYENVYEKVLGCNSVYEAFKILEITATGGGVCRCASSILDETLFDKEWINKYVTFPSSFWGDGYPVVSADKTKMLNRLEVRIKTLREIEINLKGDGNLYPDKKDDC